MGHYSKIYFEDKLAVCFGHFHSMHYTHKLDILDFCILGTNSTERTDGVYGPALPIYGPSLLGEGVEYGPLPMSSITETSHAKDILGRCIKCYLVFLLR